MKKRNSSMAGWKDLLPELLASTARRLTSVLDYTSFRGVCKSWRSAAAFDNFDSSFPQVPWLMFNELGRNKFLNLSNNKKFRTPNLPKEKKGKLPVGRYYLPCLGWLLCVTENNACLYLWHPIRPDRIQLPNRDTFSGCTTKKGRKTKEWPKTKRRQIANKLRMTNSLPTISKMTLSGSPMIESDLVIMVIWGAQKQLGFSRPGDSCWTLMEYWDGSFKDILYHKRKLYAIDDKGRVVESDIHGQTPTQMRLILSMPHFDRWHNSYYMVESREKLLFVHLPNEVFEFDLIDGSYKEIYDLGDRTLFVSHKSPSLCLEGFACNDAVQPNCIYNPGAGRFRRVGNRGFGKIFFAPQVLSIIDLAGWVVPRF